MDLTYAGWKSNQAVRYVQDALTVPGWAFSGKVPWVYVVEDRNAPPDRRILKVGSTVDLAGRLAEYRTWAIWRQSLVIHLFRPQDIDPNYSLATDDGNTTKLKEVEHTLRLALYNTGQQYLPEDHEKRDGWRTGLGKKELHSQTTNNSNPRPTAFLVPGLGGKE